MPTLNIHTAYGPVWRRGLEQLQETFDTREILDILDLVDRFSSRSREGLRAELLRLHAMAHTVINDAERTVGHAGRDLAELAHELAVEFVWYREKAKAAERILEELATKLSPRDPDDEPEE
jgi:hypothetical protein